MKHWIVMDFDDFCACRQWRGDGNSWGQSQGTGVFWGEGLPGSSRIFEGEGLPGSSSFGADPLFAEYIMSQQRDGRNTGDGDNGSLSMSILMGMWTAPDSSDAEQGLFMIFHDCSTSPGILDAGLCS